MTPKGDFMEPIFSHPHTDAIYCWSATRITFRTVSSTGWVQEQILIILPLAGNCLSTLAANYREVIEESSRDHSLVRAAGQR